MSPPRSRRAALIHGLLLKVPATGATCDSTKKNADPNTISKIHFHNGVRFLKLFINTIGYSIPVNSILLVSFPLAS